jgi:hypothetical protein
MDLNILSRVFDPILTLEPEGSRAKVGPEAFASGRESEVIRRLPAMPRSCYRTPVPTYGEGPDTL